MNPQSLNAPARPWYTTVLVILACVVASVGTLAVMAAGFALSFDGIRRVGIAAYINPVLAWMLPVAIDGAMAVAMVTAIVLRALGRTPIYPWLVVVAGAGISIACNALHAFVHAGAIELPPRIAMAVSAIPALTLALSVHLLVTLATAVVSARPAPSPAAVTIAAGQVVRPEPAPVDEEPETPEITADGVARPVTVPALAPAEHARALRAQFPDMAEAQIASIVGKSLRQVRRYLEDGAAERVSGELAEANV